MWNTELFVSSHSSPTGADCRDVPILDPHHFKIVDSEPSKDPAFVSHLVLCVYGMLNTRIYLFDSTGSLRTSPLKITNHLEMTFCASVRKKLPCHQRKR